MVPGKPFLKRLRREESKKGRGFNMMPECAANGPEKLALGLKPRAVENVRPIAEALSSHRHL